MTTPEPSTAETTPTTPTGKPITAAKQERVRSALHWYTTAAWITGVWLLILMTRVVLDYVFKMDIPMWARYIGEVHGICFMFYLATILNLGTKALWEPTKWVTTALGGVVPFLAFIVEHYRRQEVRAQFHLD